MGSRNESIGGWCSNEAPFRVMEVVSMRKRIGDKGIPISQRMLVANHPETIEDVRENLDEFVVNVIKVRNMQERDRKCLEETSRLFEQNLQQLFTMITTSKQTSKVLEKLSCSLRKALLLLALERCDNDQDEVCRTLGMTPKGLARELDSFGITPVKKAKAA